MRALLDAQALLLYGLGDRRLPPRTRTFIASTENELLISLVTIWEIVLKDQIDRLQLDRPVRQWIEHYVNALNLQLLPITTEHCFGLSALPLHHHDPFDRLLLAQARHEGLAIVTGDLMFEQYDVEIIW